MQRSTSRSEGSRPVLAVVEDDPDTLTLIDHCLQDLPEPVHRVHLASVAEAIEQLTGAPAPGKQPPDLVLLDLNLGCGTGFQVLEALRSCPAASHLPVVVFSSSPDPQDIQQAYRLGANSYVRKPVAFDAFRTAVQQITRYWLDVNHGHAPEPHGPPEPDPEPPVNEDRADLPSTRA